MQHRLVRPAEPPAVSAAEPDNTGAGCTRRVTLLTDFGTADGYVAAMKGVIAAIAPSAIIDDVSHDIPPGDIWAAAWALGAYWQLYPPGTVHVAVVDPGVGSERRALVCEMDGRFVVAPDNGLITHALLAATERRVCAMESSRPSSDTPDDLAGRLDQISATFHGRDVFAPAAARILGGTPLDDIGKPVHDPVLIDYPAVDRNGTRLLGVVVHIDRFGNLITNIPATALNGDVTGSVSAGGSVVVRGSGLVREKAQGGGQMMSAHGAPTQDSRAIPLRRTYADVESGTPVAVIGSRGTLEVSIRDGSAEGLLGARRGDGVEWTPAPTPGRGTHYS